MICRDLFRGYTAIFMVVSHSIHGYGWSISPWIDVVWQLVIVVVFMFISFTAVPSLLSWLRSTSQGSQAMNPPSWNMMHNMKTSKNSFTIWDLLECRCQYYFQLNPHENKPSHTKSTWFPIETKHPSWDKSKYDELRCCSSHSWTWLWVPNDQPLERTWFPVNAIKSPSSLPLHLGSKPLGHNTLGKAVLCPREEEWSKLKRLPFVACFNVHKLDS